MKNSNILRQFEAHYKKVSRKTAQYLLRKNTMAMTAALASSAFLGLTFQNCSASNPVMFTQAETSAYLADQNPTVTIQGPQDIAPAPSPAPSPSPSPSSSSSSSSSGSSNSSSSSGASSSGSTSSSSGSSSSGASSSGASSSGSTSSSSSGISSSSGSSSSGASSSGASSSGASSSGASGSGSGSSGASSSGSGSGSGSSSGSSSSSSSSGGSTQSDPVVNQPFSFLCSDGQSDSMNENLVEAPAVSLVIVTPADNGVACTLTGDFKNQIINSKTHTLSVDIASCNLSAGQYDAYVANTALKFVPETGAFVPTLMSNGNATNSTKNNEGSGHPFYLATSNALAAFSFHLSSSGVVSMDQQGKTVAILYDLNDQDSGYKALNARSPFNGSSTKATQALCAQRASPLIMSFERSFPSFVNGFVSGQDLTSPVDGIMFNILGQNATVPNSPIQISWYPQDTRRDFYFLVLPDVNGDVNGIDQMFGNNTMGPDGQFADNGYLALAKYDFSVPRKGYIDNTDAVYSRLRLWKDVNHDGKASPDELFSLKEKGVMAINYSGYANIQYDDPYGNQIQYQSVFKTIDGKLHIMFDLWFILPNQGD